MTAILLLAFGCPDSTESIEPFITNVMGGKKPSSAQLHKIKEKYLMIGGSSPLLRITRSQATALERMLNRKKKDFRVFVGMRYWHPFIKDTLKEIVDSGIEHISAICMTPHYSGLGIGGYIEVLKEAQAELKLNTEISIINGWHVHPLFLEAIADEIKKGLLCFNEPDIKKIQIIFSAHSLPKRLMADDDPYVREISETIMGITGFTGNISWHLGFQSRGMIPGDWLEPTVDSILERASREGKRNVLLVPISFVSDHIETLYDIDIVYKRIAESLGLKFHCSRSLNDSPKFIEALADAVREHLLRKGHGI